MCHVAGPTCTFSVHSHTCPSSPSVLALRWPCSLLLSCGGCVARAKPACLRKACVYNLDHLLRHSSFCVYATPAAARIYVPARLHFALRVCVRPVRAACPRRHFYLRCLVARPPTYGSRRRHDVQCSRFPSHVPLAPGPPVLAPCWPRRKLLTVQRQCCVLASLWLLGPVPACPCVLCPPGFSALIQVCRLPVPSVTDGDVLRCRGRMLCSLGAYSWLSRVP